MKKLLMVMVLVASAVAASAQGLRPRRTLGSRLARPTQTASQTADAAKDREAQKARAAQRSQFSVGSSTAEFDRECETLFMDIVREAEICQTNLAMYATYPYWPDAMGVVSNFCEKENCVVVDVGHHFGSWKQCSWWQGCGKNAYVVRSNLEAERWFVPQRWRKDGFCVISRGGSYTNFVYSGVGSVCCYDSDGRFVEMYDSLDKIPGMKQCFDDELKVNYAEQDRWMKAHGFAEEGSGLEAENRLDAARTNVIDRLKSLRTILSSFPQWRSDNQWYGVCDVGTGMGGPSMYGESIGTRPHLGGLRRPGSKPSVNINTNDAVLVGVNERFECLGRKQDKLIETVVRDLTGLEFGAPANTNGVLDLKLNLGSYETCTFGTNQGDVNSVTLIAEFEPSCEQKTIHEKLDQSLSTLLSSIGMDRDALTYDESPSGARPLFGRPRRQDGNQDWKSVQSFSRRFTISRNKQQSGEYGVTISEQREVEVPAVNDNARQTGLLGGSLRARRLQRQQQAAADAAKQQEEQVAKDAERWAIAEREKQQREAERAEQRQQLLAIQEELKRAREARAAASEAQVKGTVAKGDFKAKLTGIAIIEGGRMCGYEDRANNAEFLSPDTSMEIPYGKAACFRVEYDFPEGYQARVWISDRWQKGEDGSSYYFGSNPSPLYKGKGIAYGFLDMLERGKTCTLKRLAIRTNAEPKLEEPSKEWDIVVTPVDIKFHGPETAQKVPSKEDEKVISNNQPQGANSVADKLQGCDFLLNKDFKKNAKFYLCLFSASWCGPCRREMPRIAKTYAETLKNDPDIELIHFSRDQNDEKALAWAKEHDVKFPVVKPNGGNPLDLHSRGIPHLFIVKADGTLVEEEHPMRIFNEEKFRELKSGGPVATAKTSEGNAKASAPGQCAGKMPSQFMPTKGLLASFDYDGGKETNAGYGEVRRENDHVAFVEGAADYDGFYKYSSRCGRYKQGDRFEEDYVVSELNFDRFTVACSFRPAHTNNWGQYFFRIGQTCYSILEVRLSRGRVSVYGGKLRNLSAPYVDGEWNWLVVSVDVAKREAWLSVNGCEPVSTSLPEDFFWFVPSDSVSGDKFRRLTFGNWQCGERYCGQVDDLMVYDRALGREEFADVCRQTVKAKGPAAASFEKPAPAKIPELRDDSWLFMPHDEQSVYWNGTIRTRDVSLKVRREADGLCVEPPGGVVDSVLDLTLPVVDASGQPLSIVGVGSECDPYCIRARNALLSEVRLPDTLKTIRKNAFAGCMKLESIVIPENVREIGTCAFTDCGHLTKLEIWSKFVAIAEGAFSGSTPVGTDMPQNDWTTGPLTKEIKGDPKFEYAKDGRMVAPLFSFSYGDIQFGRKYGSGGWGSTRMKGHEDWGEFDLRFVKLGTDQLAGVTLKWGKKVESEGVVDEAKTVAKELVALIEAKVKGKIDAPLYLPESEWPEYGNKGNRHARYSKLKAIGSSKTEVNGYTVKVDVYGGTKDANVAVVITIIDNYMFKAWGMSPKI